MLLLNQDFALRLTLCVVYYQPCLGTMSVSMLRDVVSVGLKYRSLFTRRLGPLLCIDIPVRRCEKRLIVGLPAAGDWDDGGTAAADPAPDIISNHDGEMTCRR